ncbi:MAG: hypothetical protein ACE367_01425 [Acidimicrobiales bacterium]
MAAGAHHDRALATHADEVVAQARGRVLVLGDLGTHAAALAPTVTETVHLRHPGNGAEPLVGCFDTVVSIGALATIVDLSGFLAALAPHVHRDGVVLFCEPTVMSDQVRAEPPHDITGTFWAGDWSVIECRRFRVGRGRRARHYCWGRARLTRFVGPRRSSADGARG